MVKGEIKVGDWTLTEAGRSRLEAMRGMASLFRELTGQGATNCCEILGIDPTTDSVARDIAEEIVLHGTPVDEVLERLQKHLGES